MNKYFLLLLFYFPIILLAQDTISEQKAKVAAVNYARRYLNFENISQNNIVSVKSVKENETVLIREIQFDYGLSILMSAHTHVLPILAYSTEYVSLIDSFDFLPEGLLIFLENYCKTILTSIAIKNNQSVNNQWVDLLDTTLATSKYREVVYGPLTSTKWGQRNNNSGSYPGYNYFVSGTSDSCFSCSKCSTGCVATAMAQIMNALIQ